MKDPRSPKYFEADAGVFGDNHDLLDGVEEPDSEQGVTDGLELTPDVVQKQWDGVHHQSHPSSSADCTSLPSLYSTETLYRVT